MMHYESLGSSLLWQILTLYFFFFFFCDWQFWGDLVRHFVECSSIAIRLMFFSTSDRSYNFWKEDHKGKVLLSWHHITSAYCQHDLSLSVLILITLSWDSVCQHSVLWNSSSSLFTFSTTWKKVTICSPHSRSEELG